jgi:hypothetical protein
LHSLTNTESKSAGETLMKTLVFAAFACLAWSCTGLGADLASDPGFIQADWQGPLSLPPRFRNHCSFSLSRGRYYCSDHCGFDYQFYYCAKESFGCCKVGHGYCDWSGYLRCAP